MTDKELDTFLIETLKSVLCDLQDCAEYTKNLHTPDYDDINEDYAYSISLIKEVLSRCNSIDDLAQEDDQTIDDIYEYLASYSDNLIIHAQEPQKTQDLEQASKLEELLDLFLDDSDYSEEETE